MPRHPLARRRNTRPSGSRLQVMKNEGVALVNRSNRDVAFNDVDEPFSLVCLQAGNIDANTDHLNCVQFFSHDGAAKAKTIIGDALEFLSLRDGKRILLFARKCQLDRGIPGPEAWARTYKKYRVEPLLDMSDSPEEVRTRETLIRALKSLGLRDNDIPTHAGVQALQRLHQEHVAGREHVKLSGLEEDALEQLIEDDSAMVPIEMALSDSSAAATDAIARRQMLVGQLEELGEEVSPDFAIPALEAQLAAAEEALAATAEASKPKTKKTGTDD